MDRSHAERIEVDFVKITIHLSNRAFINHLAKGIVDIYQFNDRLAPDISCQQAFFAAFTFAPTAGINIFALKS